MRLSRHSLACILCFVTTIFSAMGVASAQDSSGSVQDALIRGCMKTCTTQGDDAFCTNYCDCTASQIREKGGDKAIKALKDSPVELLKIGSFCLGITGVATVSASCLQGCATEAGCKAKCSCFSDKLKGIGSQIEVGEFFKRLGENDVSTNEQINAMYKQCGLTAAF